MLLGIILFFMGIGYICQRAEDGFKGVVGAIWDIVLLIVWVGGLLVRLMWIFN